MFDGQTAREQRNVEWARQRGAAIQAGDTQYRDDEPMLIPRNYVQIWTMDLRSSTWQTRCTAIWCCPARTSFKVSRLIRKRLRAIASSTRCRCSSAIEIQAECYSE
ncbi:MAG: hypothetical protein NVSMB2_05430 [Chloroflexota bacterium]